MWKLRLLSGEVIGKMVGCKKYRANHLFLCQPKVNSKKVNNDNATTMLTSIGNLPSMKANQSKSY